MTINSISEALTSTASVADKTLKKAHQNQKRKGVESANKENVINEQGIQKNIVPDLNLNKNTNITGNRSKPLTPRSKNVLIDRITTAVAKIYQATSSTSTDTGIEKYANKFLEDIGIQLNINLQQAFSEKAKQIVSNDVALAKLEEAIKKNPTMKKILGIDQKLEYYTLTASEEITGENLKTISNLISKFDTYYLNEDATLSTTAKDSRSLNFSITEEDTLGSNSLLCHLELNYKDKNGNQFQKKLNILAHSPNEEINNKIFKDDLWKKIENEFKTENKELNKKIEGLNKKIEELNKKTKELNKKIEENKENKELIKALYKENKENIKKIKEENKALNKEIIEKKNSLEQLKQIFLNNKLKETIGDNKKSFPIDILKDGKRLFCLFDESNRPQKPPSDSNCQNEDFVFEKIRELLEPSNGDEIPLFFLNSGTFREHYPNNFSTIKTPPEGQERAVARRFTITRNGKQQHRTNDTEYMLFTVLYKLKEKLKTKGMENIDMKCYAFSSFKMCESCSLGMLSIILDPDSPVNHLTLIDTTHKDWQYNHNCEHEHANAQQP